jgi:hypothetical protein
MSTIAVDIAKSVFEVALSDRPGRVVKRSRLSRSQFARLLATHPPATLLMEACGTAHFWGRARKTMIRGHDLAEATSWVRRALLRLSLQSSLGPSDDAGYSLRRSQRGTPLAGDVAREEEPPVARPSWRPHRHLPHDPAPSDHRCVGSPAGSKVVVKSDRFGLDGSTMPR